MVWASLQAITLIVSLKMYALFKKEIRYFFTSPIGFTIISLFILLNGLFLTVFKTDYNIFNAGFADLLPFF